MKVAHAESSVIAAQGLKETSGFNIRASGHAFQILSSGLYSDKVRAVLREIGCNAMDAHIMAGEPNKPFRVKIPNALDDQFYIQDWGPGLSHDEVMHLYTTYFASTKQESNDVTGAFGLGSKSPFSYTDSFYVVSTHGGKKRTYTMYKGDKGIPAVSLMATEAPEPDWARGLRVGFAVKQEHIQEFSDKADEVFKWFRVAPEMRGRPPVVTVDYKFSCDDFSLIRDGDRGKVTALMGNVAYPLDLKEIGVQDIVEQKHARVLANYASRLPGLVLHLSIGDVQVAASREHLQYDPKSVKVLKEKLGLAVRRAGKEVVAALEAAVDGGWADLCQANEKLDDLLGGSGISWMFDEFAKAMNVDAVKIPILSKFIGKTYVNLPGFGTKDFKGYQGTTAYIARKNGRGMVSVYTRDTHRGTVLDIDPKTVLLTGVVERAMSRAKRAVRDGAYNQVVVVTRPGKDKTVSEATVREVAKHVAEFAGRLEVRELADFQPLDLTSARSGKRRPKNWVPTLPTGVTFECGTLDGDKALELGDPLLSTKLYMCQFTKSRWNSSTTLARAFEATLEEDDVMDWHSWEGIWNNYRTVQEAAALPGAPEAYAVLTSAQIRSIGLQKLGWTPASHAIIKYMKQPALKDALRQGIKKKHLLPADEGYLATGWMTGLAWALMRGKLSPDARARLDALGLTPQLEEMIQAKKTTRAAQRQVPPAIESYQWLVRNFSLTDELANDLRTALTVEDLDASFVLRFPHAGFLHFSHVCRSDVAYLSAATMFVLSKEV